MPRDGSSQVPSKDDAQQEIAWDAPIDEIIEALSAPPIADLREEWKRQHPHLMMPHRLSRDLLIRSITWKIQCERHGGLSQRAKRQLDEYARQLKTTGTLSIERSVMPKAGTRLIREWHGETYVVEVTDDGFAMDTKTYASLSHVARAITGTRWSGPRFFGLKNDEGREARIDW